MLKNYLKIAFRNILRFKVYSFVSVAGLTIGLVLSFLILLFVQNELSYDRYNKNAEDIYRLREDFIPNGGSTIHTALSSAAIGPALLADFPEVRSFVRFFKYFHKAVISYRDKNFFETKFFFADSSVFNIFTWHLLEGDPKTALTEPYTVVITKSMARKYFGKEDPVGKILSFNHWKNFRVTGIVQDLSPDSHFTFNFLASFATLKSMLYTHGELNDWQGNLEFYTYLMLRKNSSPQGLEEQIQHLIAEHAKATNYRLVSHLEPLTSIHLHSSLEYEIAPQGDIAYVRIFSVVAILVLLIACINFVNISTARSATRMREVGIRKVVGAKKSQLIGQFLGESVLLSVIALVFAFGMTEVLLPVFNFVTGKDLALDVYHHLSITLDFVGVALLVGIIAGIYPAFVLSSFHPAETVKRVAGIDRKAVFLRRGLVAAQFAISIALIICTYLIFLQLKYTEDKRLGFNKEQVIVLPTMWNHNPFKNELLKNSKILGVAIASALPGKGILSTYNVSLLDGGAGQEPWIIKAFYGDFDFARTLKLDFTAGRDFSERFSTDSNTFIINEAACKKFGFNSPKDMIGRRVLLAGWLKGSVIGVVKDFNFESLHQRVDPVIITPVLYGSDEYIAVRIAPHDIRSTLGLIKQEWHKFAPDTPFEWSFLSDDLNALYKSDERLATIFGYFSSSGILIACLGLFGLAAFSLERRTKEIAIRKVHGASISNIVFLLSRESFWLVLSGNIVAWPVAYFVMSKWLETFAYRVSISPWVFVTSAALALIIASLTVSFHAIKAATANPVESLRYE